WIGDCGCAWLDSSAMPSNASPAADAVAIVRNMIPSKCASRRWRKSHAAPPRQILHILPRHAPRARAARGGPFERLAGELSVLDRNAVVGNVAGTHRQVFVLAATMEAEPKPEAIGQRDLLLHRLAGVDRRRALVLHHLARHQVATV